MESSAAARAFQTLPGQFLESTFPGPLEAINRNPEVILWNAKEVANFSVSSPIS